MLIYGASFFSWLNNGVEYGWRLYCVEKWEVTENQRGF